MARWIAFDKKTSSLLRSNLGQGTTVETFGRGAIDYALAKPGAVVTLLPAAGGLDIGIAVFRRPKLQVVNAPPLVAPVPVGKVSAPVVPAPRPKAPLPPKAMISKTRVAPTTRAGGFLGLSDESVIEDESIEPEKKSWWQKLWDEDE